MEKAEILRNHTARGLVKLTKQRAVLLNYRRMELGFDVSNRQDVFTPVQTFVIKPNHFCSIRTRFCLVKRKIHDNDKTA